MTKLKTELFFPEDLPMAISTYKESW